MGKRDDWGRVFCVAAFLIEEAHYTGFVLNTLSH
jgi:hypothetical protein